MVSMKDIGTFHELLHYWTAQIGKPYLGRALRPHYFVDICLQTPGGKKSAMREVLNGTCSYLNSAVFLGMEVTIKF